MSQSTDVGWLTRRVSTGTLWVLFAFVAARGFTFGTNVVLARLLSPPEFGVVSFAMVLIAAFTLLQDFGVPQAIVYSERDPAELAGTALTINAVAAMILVGLTALVAPTFAAFGNQPVIAPVVVVLSIGMLISSFGSTQSALLKKQLAFRRNAVPDLAPPLVAGLVSIALALNGFGVWSLVYGYVARAVVMTGLLWFVASVRPWPRLDLEAAVYLLRYGRHVSFSGILGFAMLNVDYAVVGHYLGSTDLGIYTLAYTIATLQSNAVNQVITTVAFPAYARLKDDMQAMLRLFMRVFSIAIALAVSIALFLFVCTPAYAPVVLGAKWSEIIRPLQVLAIFGVLETIDVVFPSFMRAIGRPDVVWKLNLLRLALLVPLMLAVLPAGITGIATVHVAVGLVLAVTYASTMARLIHISIVTLWRPALLPILSSAGLGVLVLGSRALPAVDNALDQPLGSALFAFVCLTGYSAILASRHPYVSSLLQTCRVRIQEATAAPGA